MKHEWSLWLGIIALMALVLIANFARAHGHPVEICDPEAPSVCSRAGEDQDVTFLTTALPGGTVSVPVTLRDLSDQICEFGGEWAYDPVAFEYPTFRFNIAEFTQEECDHVFDIEGGCFTGTSLPVPSLVFFTTPGGSSIGTVECPECTGLARLRAWAYSGGVAPQYPLGSRTRVLGYWDFPVRESAPPGRYLIAQEGAWVDHLDPAGTGTCDCPTQGIGRSCGGTVRAWEDVPQGAEANQVSVEVPCAWSGDADSDGFVGIADLGLFKQQYGQPAPTCGP